MSTKSSLAYHRDDFHLYRDVCGNEDDVYLELRGSDLDFAIEPGSVTVRIPGAVWQTIRKCGDIYDLSLKDSTDAELEAFVTEQVDRRIAHLATLTDPRSKVVTAFFGALTFGLADSPREQQIAKGLKFFRARRQELQDLFAKIQQYRTGIVRPEEND